MLGTTKFDFPIKYDYAEAVKRVTRWSLENELRDVSRDPTMRKYRPSHGILANSVITIDVVIGDRVVHVRGYIQTLLKFVTWKLVIPAQEDWLTRLDSRRRDGALIARLQASLGE